jgi:riboflavin synthase
MLAQVLTGVHILEVFVHAAEEADENRLVELCRRRVEGHALNAYWLVCAPDELRERAGQGVRQGGPDAGPLNAEGAVAPVLAPCTQVLPSATGL